MTTTDDPPKTTALDVMRVPDHRKRINAIQRVMRSVMKKGIHYGPVPGCGPKPVLLKPGAEILCATFFIRPRLIIEELAERAPEHRRYRVTVRGLDPTGELFFGEGIGECSTAESKYAWRRCADQREWNETPDTHRRHKYFKNRMENQVRTNPADVANTCLKIAKKRGLVDMVITALAAGDIFAQDLDDGMVEGFEEQPPKGNGSYRDDDQLAHDLADEGGDE